MIYFITNKMNSNNMKWMLRMMTNLKGVRHLLKHVKHLIMIRFETEPNQAFTLMPVCNSLYSQCESSYFWYKYLLMCILLRPELEESLKWKNEHFVTRERIRMTETISRFEFTKQQNWVLINIYNLIRVIY